MQQFPLNLISWHRLSRFRPAAVLELTGGDVVDLGIGVVAKKLGDRTVRMLGFARENA